MEHDQVGAAEARSRILRDLGRPQEALAVVEKALATYPDSADLLVEAARARLAIGGRSHLKRATEMLRRAVSLEPDDPWATALLGTALLFTLTQAGEGEALLERACELAPLDPEIAYAQAFGLSQRSVVRWDKAHAAVMRAVALAPSDPKILLLKAKIELARLSPFDQAGRERLVEDIRGILAIDPTNADAAYLLAKAGPSVAPAADVAARYHAAVRLDPRHAEAVARVDSSLVAPLRSAYWTLWALVLLQAFLLWRQGSWGTGLNVLLFLFVLLLPWVRFVRARRRSPAGFGRHGGPDPLLWVFGATTYLAAFAFKVSVDGFGGGSALWVCVGVLLGAGAAYLLRSVRRRRRYG